jgi:hypothetical protein
MELDDVEIGQKYRCDYKGERYFATVVSKADKAQSNPDQRSCLGESRERRAGRSGGRVYPQGHQAAVGGLQRSRLQICQLKACSGATLDVRFWPKADTRSCCVRVRFRGQSGHGAEIA